MSREKQIEEMAKVYYEAMLRAHPIDVANGKASTYYATAFYNAGYRKQSEWISVEERLPSKSGKYICCTTKGTMLCGSCLDKEVIKWRT